MLTGLVDLGRTYAFGARFRTLSGFRRVEDEFWTCSWERGAVVDDIMTHYFARDGKHSVQKGDIGQISDAASWRMLEPSVERRWGRIGSDRGSALKGSGAGASAVTWYPPSCVHMPAGAIQLKPSKYVSDSTKYCLFYRKSLSNRHQLVWGNLVYVAW